MAEICFGNILSVKMKESGGTFIRWIEGRSYQRALITQWHEETCSYFKGNGCSHQILWLFCKLHPKVNSPTVWKICSQHNVWRCSWDIWNLFDQCYWLWYFQRWTLNNFGIFSTVSSTSDVPILVEKSIQEAAHLSWQVKDLLMSSHHLRYLRSCTHVYWVNHRNVPQCMFTITKEISLETVLENTANLLEMARIAVPLWRSWMTCATFKWSRYRLMLPAVTMAQAKCKNS